VLPEITNLGQQCLRAGQFPLQNDLQLSRIAVNVIVHNFVTLHLAQQSAFLGQVIGIVLDLLHMSVEQLFLLLDDAIHDLVELQPPAAAAAFSPLPAQSSLQHTKIVFLRAATCPARTRTSGSGPCPGPASLGPPACDSGILSVGVVEGVPAVRHQIPLEFRSELLLAVLFEIRRHRSPSPSTITRAAAISSAPAPAPTSTCTCTSTCPSSGTACR